MNVSAAGRDFLIAEEGCRRDAYLDTAGIPTIGVGMTRYPDGRKVMLGDTITDTEARDWFGETLGHFTQAVDTLTTDQVTSNQFDALVCLVYNIGVEAYRGSILRTVINQNPTNRQEITRQWRRWKHINGKSSVALMGRRERELERYFA